MCQPRGCRGWLRMPGKSGFDQGRPSRPGAVGTAPHSFVGIRAFEFARLSRALRTCFADDSSQARDGVVDRGFARAERETRVVQEARSAAAAALPGIDVEEVAG